LIDRHHSVAGAVNRNPEGVTGSNNLCLPLEFVSNNENSSCRIIPSNPVARVVVAITEVLEKSFSLHDQKSRT
jgi:hypothetical protein